MDRIRIATRSGPQATLGVAALDPFMERLHGRVIGPHDDDYDEARAVWNGMIDRHPALIVRCADTEDVATAVALARQHDLRVAVYGGGHNIAGHAVCDDGLVIDLRQMRGVEVDAGARRATVQGGALLSDVDAATQAHGLATPLGINSTTGVAGLTLGGGFGWLSRAHGLAVDNLVAAEVVTADGEVRRVDQQHDPDLFWALRGGGGNFGVVTSFEFRLHPVGPEVLCGVVAVAGSDAAHTLHELARFMADGAPDELSVFAILRDAPPLPFIPLERHGQPALMLALCWAGDVTEGEAFLDPVRNLASDIWGEHIGVQPYTSWQQTFDPMLTAGARNYWKSHNFTELTGAAIGVIVDAARTLPGPECDVLIAPLGGAVNRVPHGATAYGQRDVRAVLSIHGRWVSPLLDGPCITWARDTYRATEPHADGGVYLNFLTEEEGERVQAAFGGNLARLRSIKRRYDPDNLFRLNPNITPA